MKLEQIISEARRKSGLSQTDFGEMLGLNAGAGSLVSKYERGLVTPSIETFSALTTCFSDSVVGHWLGPNIWVDSEGEEHDFRAAPNRLAAPRPLKSPKIDPLIVNEYAEAAARIYRERTEGDFTWKGLLVSFLLSIDASRAESEEN